MATFFICGDIINRYSPNQFIDNQIIDIIKNADYSICNLEGPILPENSISHIGVYQQNLTTKNLKNAGFDMLLLANNHITDRGNEGLKFTITEAKRFSFDYIGAGFSFEEVYKAKIIKINELKFGLINICEAQVGQFVDNQQEYGYAWMSHSYIEKLIERTKKEVDYLLLFVHAGLEHYDLPLIEYRKLYKRYCDLGVDCVIGSHPHVAQGIEKYNNKYIFYSLGNFYFPRKPEANSTDVENHSFSILLNFTKNGVDYSPIYHSIDKLKVKITSSEQSLVKLNLLNNNLKEPNYSILIEHIYLKTYNQLCRKLYIEALMGSEKNDSFITTIKQITKYIFFRNKYWGRTQVYRDKLLLRLIQNETYQFVAQYVLTMKIRNEEKN